MADRRIGCYICQGCSLGERLDTDRLESIATREGKVDYARQHPFLCSQSGVGAIRADIESEGTTHLVIAACSSRAKTDAFRFDGVAMARANLREGVIWARPDSGESSATTQEMADDYVRMAAAEIKHMMVPSSSDEQAVNRHLLVVGGGYSGLTAANESAKAGYRVTLVEKSEALGGFAAKLHRRIPARSPYAAPEDPGIAGLMAEVKSEPRITVLTSTWVNRTNGAPGRFEVELHSGAGEARRESFGAIIQASGFQPYDPSRLTELSYSDCRDVITQAELETLAREADGAEIERPSDGKAVESVVFVQCAGQRSEKPGHLPYCSGFCCGASIKQALYFKEANPDAQTTVLYTDLRTPGSGGEDFYRSAQNQGVMFSKGVVRQISHDDGGLRVEADDLILGEPITYQTDLVVLATGMIANSGVDPEAVSIEDEEAGDMLDSPAERVEIPVESILNLSYRQGTDLPQLAQGFTDSHFICFPYETRRTGIYSSGPVRRPMDLVQAKEDATGAAMKAIQAIENAGKGRAAHPRSGDLSFPTVRLEGCTQCKRCTVECPFGAIDEDAQRYPLFNESRCRRCGTCMGACPVRVISFENYSIDTVGQQIKSVDMPDEAEEKPRILVLACENDAYPALDMAAMNGRTFSAYARVIPVRCLGSVNSIWVTDALNSGYDAVMLMGCQKGENYQCHFVKGSEIAHYRMGKIDDTLEQLSLEKERVAAYEVAITDVDRAARLIDEMAERIDEIGLSPLKF